MFNNESSNVSTEVTNLTQHEPEVTQKLPLFAQMTISLMLLSMVAIVAGNMLVLVAVLRFRTLQDITGIFVANLAVSDLIIGLVQPFQVSFFFYPMMEQNKYACLLRYIIIIIACNASLYSLFCTVVDRFISIVYPLRYPSIMTKKLALGMVICIWIIDLGIGFVPLFAINNWDVSPICLYELVMDKYFRLVNHVSNIVLAFAMFFIYVRIYSIVRKHVRQIQNEAILYTGDPNFRRTQTNSIVVAIIVLFFHISWLPFSVIELTMLDIKNVTKEKVLVANFLVFLGVLNSVVNPVVYAWKNTQYRRAFKRLLGLNDSNNTVVPLA